MTDEKGLLQPLPQADLQLTAILISAARDKCLSPVAGLEKSLSGSSANALQFNQIRTTVKRSIERAKRRSHVAHTLHKSCGSPAPPRAKTGERRYLGGSSVTGSELFSWSRAALEISPKPRHVLASRGNCGGVTGTYGNRPSCLVAVVLGSVPPRT